ncbi:hypothetical protein UA08_02573 [Talaromyces atroroseus]|uniref:Rhodopsin domain-containing protein n=1 Tax=Talaromyces atroroseus TaxID=1441469 RepID=A0A225B595_TALAT|nr:hypothetical protein UA08_02573 [Talaromyces atroroseus]OKL62446.1 hypothetical protein UA08_02573 [Talaromyces atroroseus]
MAQSNTSPRNHRASVLGGTILAFGLSFSICYGTSKGLGLHFANIPQEWLSQLGGSIYAFTVLYYPAVLITKISILVLYLRIFQSNTFVRRVSLISIAVIACAYVALTCAKVFRCQPVSGAWQLAPGRPVKCIDIVVIHLASTPVNLYTDLAIILLPIPVLSSLQLPRQQKFILILTFALAAFDVVISVIRTAVLEQVLLKAAVENRLHGYETPASKLDITYTESLAFMWSAVEVNIGIVCACIITLRPLVGKVFPKMLEDSRRKQSSGGSSSTKPESSRAEEKDASSFRPNWNVRAPSSNEVGNDGHPDPFVSSSATCFVDREEHRHAVQMERAVELDVSVARADFGAGPSREANYYPMEFITTPEISNVPSHRESVLIPQSPEAHQRLFRFFCFYLPSKCINNLSTKESYLPVAIITTLFFIVQFLLGLMNVQVAEILGVLNISSLRSVQLQATYFSGYFLGALFISRFTLAKFSLHVTLLTGLLILSVAPMIFWPTAVLLTIPGLLVSYLILGLGFSVVYNGFFVFVLLCGPLQFTALRLLFLQAIGNIGKLLSFILATQFIFPDNQTETTILNSQWTFLGVTFIVVFLTILLYYIPLTGVSYDDLARDTGYLEGARQTFMPPFKKAYICNRDVCYTTLALGVFSAFCYSGLNSVITYIFTDYVHSMDPTSALNERYLTWIAGAALVVGQLVAVPICYYSRPSWVLLICCVTNIILSTLTLTVEGTAGVVVIVVLQMFVGPVFPLLLSISLSRLRRHTFAASTYVTATLSAGALFIPVTYFVQRRPSANPIQYSFSVGLACSCFGIAMPLFINISRAARKQVNRRGKG